MAGDCVLAIDQGTTGTTALLVDARGDVLGRGYREITQRYPRPGWVEHDPEEIWQRTLEAVAEARRAVPSAQLAGLGIANQRETTVVWDATTGKPAHPAIVWQCRRTAPLCERLREAGLGEWFAERTGLVLDAYFSGTKLQWLLDNVPGLRALAERGQLRFGTVDSWLIWKLTGGRVHATDYSNASRTLLFNLHTLDWDPQILDRLAIPGELLPRVVPSSQVLGHTVGAETASPDGPIEALPAGLPIAGAAGDQQAALFGQACFRPGMVKTTYGTGAFLLMHTGTRPVLSRRGLLTTVAWGLDGRVEYALEGSLFIAGAAIQWLRDGLGLLNSSAESEETAAQVPDTGGVYLVPAFVGLGAPHWDMYARGTIVGLTRGTSRAHLVRAALESIAYQTRDVVDAMSGEAETPPEEIRIDGGAAANNLLAQFQADILGVSVVRPRVTETTALGAAYLAGLAVGLWRSQEELSALWQVDRRFAPAMPDSRRQELYRGWLRAVEKAKGWVEP